MTWSAALDLSVAPRDALRTVARRRGVSAFASSSPPSPPETPASRLRRSLGTPCRSEAWWNSSVATRGRGNLASCVFLVDGARASCDVQVTMIRAPSRGVAAYLPNLARNLANPEAWRVSRMEAILPHEREAGLPGRVNLLQDPEPKGAVLDERRKGNRRRWLRWPRWLGGGRNER